MATRLIELGWRSLKSNRRTSIRLLIFPVLAAFVSYRWVCAVGSANLLVSRNQFKGALFLVFSAIASGLAGSIAIVPPRRRPRTKATFPVSAGIILWCLCALICFPQYLIGVVPNKINVWIIGPAALYTFLSSYEIELPLILVCGVICLLIAFLTRDFRADSSGEDKFGYAVWLVCVARAGLLVGWGPLNGFP
jgi:hypothetical protein